MSTVTLTDAAGAVIGYVDMAGRRTMLRHGAASGLPVPPRVAPTFFGRAARCARMFKVSPSHFTDAAMDAGCDRSTARQGDAEKRRGELETLMTRDAAAL